MDGASRAPALPQAPATQPAAEASRTRQILRSLGADSDPARRRSTARRRQRLARYFGTTPQFWMNLQAACDLAVATRASADQPASGRVRRGASRTPVQPGARSG
jgi:hypothetical protein